MTKYKSAISALVLSLVCALQAPVGAATESSSFPDGSGSRSVADLVDGLRVEAVKPGGSAVPSAPANTFNPDPSFLDQKRTEHIWPEMVFLRGADYAEFEYTMNQNRDQVRRMLMQEFGEVLIPMASSFSDLNELAKTLYQIIMAFDQVHNQHKDEAVQGIRISFENEFRAAIDELYRANGGGDELRKMEFLYPGSPLVKDIKAHSQRKSLPQEVLASMDYVLYGSYTMQGGGNISVTLTVEKLKTGQTRSFEVTAPINVAMQRLARKVFAFFQSNDYTEWMDPQPNLTWIPPAPTQPKTTANIAKLYCRGQGARLPYARELLLASQGSSLRPGGIPPLVEGNIYLILDKQYWDKQYYFFTGSSGEASGGPVRTGAGYGVINGAYWCVRGPVSKDVRFYEDVYELIRRPETTKPVREALECILAKLDDFGAEMDHGNKFSTIEKTVAFLAKEGYVIHLPE
jgi:hypothetical protein